MRTTDRRRFLQMGSVSLLATVRLKPDTTDDTVRIKADTTDETASLSSRRSRGVKALTFDPRWDVVASDFNALARTLGV